MAITILAEALLMLGYFLILYAGVAWIQDKRFFSSAPQENLAAIPDRKERFRGAHAIGGCIAAVAVALFAGAFVLAAWDGIQNGYPFFRLFGRFWLMLTVMEVYDIAFFDWVLLCHSDFFPHYYPELKGVVGPHQFGYNKNVHIRHFILYVPLSAAMAGVCMLFLALTRGTPPAGETGLDGGCHAQITKE